MPPKKPLSNRPPAPSSSSSEEVSDTEDREMESEVPISKANRTQSVEAGSESSSSQFSVSNFAVVPITSKRIGDFGKPEEYAARPIVLGLRSDGSKRIRQSGTDKNGSNKKKKVLNDGEAEDQKKRTVSQRIWNDEDEIQILKGMIDYQTEKGSCPYADNDAFYEFVKKRVYAKVSKTQVMDKIKRLRKKYQSYANESVDGKDLILGMPHAQQVYIFSKMIWGPISVNNGENKKKKVEIRTEDKNDDAILEKLKEVDTNDVGGAEPKGHTSIAEKENLFTSSALLLVLEANITSNPEATSSLVRSALPLIDSAKIKEFDQKWKELQTKQLKLAIKKFSMVVDAAKLVLEAMKSE